MKSKHEYNNAYCSVSKGFSLFLYDFLIEFKQTQENMGSIETRLSKIEEIIVGGILNE